MNQELFERNNDEAWCAFDTMITQLEKRSHGLVGTELREFPRRYRQICKHLALARDRRYSAHVVDRLNSLVLRGHHKLYTSKTGHWHQFLQFFTTTFPRAVRGEARLFWLCCLLFYGPYFGSLIMVQMVPETVYSILPAKQVMLMEQMYDPAQRQARDVSMDITMFGFYIRNNVGIGFRTFAGGFLAGLGTLFFLIYNGLMLGSVTGHIANQPYSDVFFNFVAGHGAFELTGIVLAGVAGMRLGLALIFPGNLSRRQALIKAGKNGLVLVYGFFGLLVLAALIEAFWSPRDLPNAVKYAVGAFFWLFTAAYFLFMGRRS